MFTIEDTPLTPVLMPTIATVSERPPVAKLTKPVRKARAAGRELKPTHEEYDEVALLTPMLGMVRLDIDATAGDGEFERCVCVLSVAQALHLREQLTRAITEAEAQRQKGGK